MFENTPSVGETVARLRYRRDWTQEELAEHARVSVATVRAIEQGARAGRIKTLGKLALALGVSTSDLLASARGVSVVADREPGGLLAIRQVLTPPLGLDAGQAADAAESVDWPYELRRAELLYAEDKYDEVLATVPGLIEDARALGSGVELAQAYLYAANALTQVRQLDLANHVLDKAMVIAQTGSDEMLAAWVAGIQCWTLLLQGRFRDVEQLATVVADRIEPGMGNDDVARLSTWGWLMMRASAAAIRDARVDDAGAYLQHAQRAAVKRAERTNTNGWAPPPVQRFCSATVGFKQVENAVLLGDHGKALELAGGIAPSRMPTVNNLNRHRLDLAASQLAVRQPAAAVEQLLDLRQAAPEWMRHQSYARSVVRGLQRSRRRGIGESIDLLATHVGIPA
ncbi:helix-turn-helix domain-containing protein [Kribbella sp. NPDC059898]|uniref:helix-turn-helix domain-containing protein n=1 Tax=Kribbella sp. NPDC059898 TaxID=3346995 RepID=UPI00365ECDC6